MHSKTIVQENKPSILPRSSIIDVAKLAKVSPVTVARAFTRMAPVADKTRKKIMAAADKLGYRPNLLARGLRGGRTQTIGILWSLCGPHPSINTVEEIALRAQKHDYVTYIADSLSDSKITQRALDDFAQRHVDGVVFQWGFPDPMDESLVERLVRFPAAVVVSGVEVDDRLDQIVHNRHRPIRDVADHFAQTHRCRPAMLIKGGTQNDKTQAFVAQVRTHSLNVPPEMIIDYDCLRSETNKEGISKFLDDRFPVGRPMMDCILCHNDEGAAAVIQWLYHRGFKVPNDVAVVGINDSDFARFYIPPIASIARRDDEVAEVVDRVLFMRLNDPSEPMQKIHIPMRFIHRESAG